MRDKFKQIIKSDLVRNSSILVSGNMIGQVIAFLATMVLTRIYTDADFGIFALFMSVATILGHVGTGKYEEAIIMSKNRSEAFSLVGFIAFWLPLFSIFLLAVLFYQPLFSFFRIEAISDYRLLIPVMVLVIGIFSTLTSLANREKRFKAIAGANITQNTASSLSKIVIHPLWGNAWGLLSGQIFSYLIACIPFYKLRKDIRLSIKQSWKDKKETARIYVDFPKYNMPRNILNSISFNLPFLMLTGVFGQAYIGLFFLAFNTSFRPINLVVNSLYQVLYEKAAQLKNRNAKISPILNAYTRNNILYILPCFVFLFIFAPQLFALIFSEEWRESGVYLRYILPWLYMILFTSPLAFVPLLFKKQKVYMWYEISYFALRLASIYVGIRLEDFGLAILLFSMTGALFMFIQYIWYRWSIIRYEKTLG